MDVMRKVVAAAPASVIKSIQTGSITVNAASSAVTTNTATITSVDTTKAFVIFEGAHFASFPSTVQFGASVVLTNATTVTASASLISSDASNVNIVVRFTVVEFT